MIEALARRCTPVAGLSGSGGRSTSSARWVAALADALPGSARSTRTLTIAIQAALGASARACVEEGQRYDWEHCTDQFLAGLQPGRPASPIEATDRLGLNRVTLALFGGLNQPRVRPLGIISVGFPVDLILLGLVTP